jgi:hypothetical protein
MRGKLHEDEPTFSEDLDTSCPARGHAGQNPEACGGDEIIGCGRRPSFSREGGERPPQFRAQSTSHTP